MFTAIVYTETGSRFDSRGFPTSQERDAWIAKARDRYPTTFSIEKGYLD